MKGASSSRVFCRRQPPFRGSFPHQAKAALETMYGLSSIPAPSRMDTVSGYERGGYIRARCSFPAVSHACLSAATGSRRTSLRTLKCLFRHRRQILRSFLMHDSCFRWLLPTGGRNDPQRRNLASKMPEKISHTCVHR